MACEKSCFLSEFDLCQQLAPKIIFCLLRKFSRAVGDFFEYANVIEDEENDCYEIRR